MKVEILIKVYFVKNYEIRKSGKVVFNKKVKKKKFIKVYFIKNYKIRKYIKVILIKSEDEDFVKIFVDKNCK